MAKTRVKQAATERKASYTAGEGLWEFQTESGLWQLSDKLIPAMAQDESAGYRSVRGCHALSAEEVFSVIDAMRGIGGEVVEGAREFLKQAMGSNSPSTQTRVIYTPNRTDRIIHGYGTESAVERKARLVGPDGNVNEVLSIAGSKALTGKTPEQVSELMKYVNGTPAYIWRVNSNPSSNDERVVRLIAYSDWAGLGAGRDPRVAGPRLGGKFSREARK